MKGNAPERLVSGSDDFTMFLWEPAISKHPKARLTGHQQVYMIHFFSSLLIVLALFLSFILKIKRNKKLHKKISIESS